jgi:hypothetical protein
LSQDLVDACADLSERPESIGELVEAMDKLAETYHDVEGMLQDIDELLKVCCVIIKRNKSFK